MIVIFSNFFVYCIEICLIFFVMAKYKLCMSDKNEPIFISDGVVVQDVKSKCI